MASPPWNAECLDNIAKIGGIPCPEDRCVDTSGYLHRLCNCLPPYSNGCSDPPTPGCCTYTYASPIPVLGPEGMCYCCCGTIHFAAAVQVGEGRATPAHEIAVGDVVRTALDPKLQHWALVPARFSSGTGAGASGPGLEIRFGDPHELETVLADADQLFLVDGRLKRASRLVAGQDRLTRPDGSQVEILELDAVDELGPRHRIATSEEPATDWAGHLIVVNGVVCGDYSLQLADLDADAPEMMAEGHADLPAFGTAAYGASRNSPAAQGE
jgi:hypothetical protein